MALSRERIAQEVLKLLAAADPLRAVRLMVDHGIFRPVLPEIGQDGVARLGSLVAREGAAGDPIRRLAALLPPQPDIAEAIANRLKLSNAQRKRLMLAAEPDLPASPRALAYAVGVDAARDRLLLRADDDAWQAGLATLQDWAPPRLPLSGGALIAMGLPAGPVVARSLQEVERRWIEEGFPDAARVEMLARSIVGRHLGSG
jgi:poly(A) polymerase